MGKLDLKLMQGVKEVEGQFQKDTSAKDIPKGRGKEPGPIAGKKLTPEEREKLRECPGKPEACDRPKDRRTAEANSRKGKKQVFSFRALVSDINIWKAYVNAVSGGVMEKICSQAMNEYITSHKLSEAEQAVFEALMKREESEV